MRAVLAAGLALAMAGCGGRAGQPVQLSAPAPAPMATTMSCITEELDDMAYEVSSSDAQTGEIRATRLNEQPWWLKLIGYRDVSDQLTATVAGGELRVTAASSDPEATSVGGASSAAERDARRLLGECGSQA